VTYKTGDGLNICFQIMLKLQFVYVSLNKYSLNQIFRKKKKKKKKKKEKEKKKIFLNSTKGR
jgi:Zn/Cd-binding protein ZinT